MYENLVSKTKLSGIIGNVMLFHLWSRNNFDRSFYALLQILFRNAKKTLEKCFNNVIYLDSINKNVVIRNRYLFYVFYIKHSFNFEN